MDWRCCYCCISWCLKSRDETRQSDISKGKDAESEEAQEHANSSSLALYV